MSDIDAGSSSSTETAWLEHFASWSPADVVPYPPHPVPRGVSRGDAAGLGGPGSSGEEGYASSEVWSSRTRGDATVTAYYAAGRRYDDDDPARPAHLNFHKVDRVNFAFFQTDAAGNVWGTDPWADPVTLL